MDFLENPPTLLAVGVLEQTESQNLSAAFEYVPLSPRADLNTTFF